MLSIFWKRFNLTKKTAVFSRNQVKLVAIPLNKTIIRWKSYSAVYKQEIPVPKWKNVSKQCQSKLSCKSLITRKLLITRKSLITHRSLITVLMLFKIAKLAWKNPYASILEHRNYQYYHYKFCNFDISYKYNFWCLKCNEKNYWQIHFWDLFVVVVVVTFPKEQLKVNVDLE